MSSPTLVRCPKCNSPAGDSCRTAGGKHKAPCKERIPKADAPPQPCGCPAVVDGLKGAHLPGCGYVKAAVATGATMAAWSRENTPAPPSPTDEASFDESTPPPRTRPRGEAVPAHVELVAGEDFAALFGQWDREGRVPAGSLAARFVGVVPFGIGKSSGYKLLAGDNPFGVRCGQEIPVEELEPYRVSSTIVQRGAGTFVVLSPVRKQGGL